MVSKVGPVVAGDRQNSANADALWHGGLGYWRLSRAALDQHVQAGFVVCQLTLPVSWHHLAVRLWWARNVSNQITENR